MSPLSGCSSRWSARSGLRASPRRPYSYGLSVRLLADYLKDHGRPLTVDVSRDDIREFIAEQGTRREITDFKGRVHMGGSPATAAAPAFECEPTPIVPDETLTLLLKVRSGTSLEHRRDAAILRLFLDTSCRLSEITTLKVGDIDLKRQVVAVRGNGNRVRVVTFGERTYKALDRYLRQLERERCATTSSRPAQMRETSLRLIPERAPSAPTRSSTARVETPWTWASISTA